MKKILFLLLCVTTLCSAQKSPIDGFWGIKFGASYEDVKTVMMQKKGCSQTSNPSNKIGLVFTGVEFAGEKPASITFYFYENKFGVANVLIKPNDESNIFRLYDELRSTILLKYGEPTLTKEKFKYPFEKGDGMELMALEDDKLDVSTVWWQQEITKGIEKTYGKSIMISLTKMMAVSILYADEKLMTNIEATNKEQNSNDL